MARSFSVWPFVARLRTHGPNLQKQVVMLARQKGDPAASDWRSN